MPPYVDTGLSKFLPSLLISVAIDLHYLTHVVEEETKPVAQRHEFSSEEAECFAETFNIVQYLLASFPYPHQVQDHSTRYHCQNIWRCAAMIYFLCGLRKSPLRALLWTASGRLRDSLQQSDIASRLGEGGESVVVWMLFMGYCGAADHHLETRLWYVREVNRLLETLGVETMAGLGRALAGFLYRPSVFDTKLEELWMTLRALEI